MLVPTPPVVRPHGVGVRGADLNASSVLFEGRFGRIFRSLPPAEFGATEAKTTDNLQALADTMKGGADDPKDGPDPEESDIPAGYTYLGQFIDHDLTFDPASSLQRQNDPDALVDFRTPRFDLDSLYGRGPDDQPYLYVPAGAGQFELAPGGALAHAGSSPNLNDHPRFNNRALIGDPRNDENQIVAQLHTVFAKFHNRLTQDQDLNFVEAQRATRFHYQWVVLRDFLLRIIDPGVLGRFGDWLLDPAAETGDVCELRSKLRFYRPKESSFIPLEFSTAAYRFGHSMVRPGYRMNDDDGSLEPIFNPEGDREKSLTGFQPVPADHAIDWGRFLYIDGRDQRDPKKRTQLAYKIDTSFVNPLATLPDSVAADVKSLAARNLIRGWRLRLPSGQAIARAMGVVPLKDEEILIVTEFQDAAPGADNQGCMVVKPIADVAGGIFQDNCPLWTYVLAETVPVYNGTDPQCQSTKEEQTVRTPSTRRLGPVGGGIVAETIIGLLINDTHSFLSQEPLWRPTVVPKGAPFELGDFVKYALRLD